MNQKLEALILIGATDHLAQGLEALDLPFDRRGTPFALTGHRLTHHDDRYVENGSSDFTLGIPKVIQISSNVGSAQRRVHYILVTELASPAAVSLRSN